MNVRKKAIAAAILLLLAAGASLCAFLQRDSGWKVTQYASVSGGQAMFYTITDSRGYLAIVDGGFDVDSEQVLRQIRKHHNHVDAWILTHTHPDHVGAFNAIMSDPSGRPDVDHIYTVQANTERYRETARDYDDFSAHEDFETAAETLPQLEYLKENDILDLDGLRMKVLSAWDGQVDAMDSHLCNNGSLMFRLDAPQRSMLFCADVQAEREPYILAGHRQELAADYVQCGHHGNWGLSEAFYDLVRPEEAFLDGPEYLFEESDLYDGYQLKEYFKEKGVICHSFADAPSSVVLK